MLFVYDFFVCGIDVFCDFEIVEYLLLFEDKKNLWYLFGVFFSLVSFGCFWIEFYMYNKDMKYNIRSKKSILKLKIKIKR